MRYDLMIMISMVVLLSPTSAISYSMTSSWGGSFETSNARLEDSVAEWTMLS